MITLLRVLLWLVFLPVRAVIWVIKAIAKII